MREKPSARIMLKVGYREEYSKIRVGVVDEIIAILDEQAQQIAELEAWRESVKGQLLDDNRIRG